ncbi:hypothetical protein ACE193_14690 [Bernardetia sp. OM2101]|uniref:hypothetical protein n=1 Tax=Bernardetia sp. OM2101 TaxID=3344876 RepID=UPI0035CFB4CC
MDIDNLKSTWQALQTQSEPVFENDQIRKLLQGKAKDSISKIKRSIWIESSLTLVIGVVFILNKHWFYSPFIIPYLLFVLSLCLGWYTFQYYKIRKINLQDNLKKTLEHLIKTLDLYLKVYLYGSLALGLFASILPLFWTNVTLDSLTLTKMLLIVAGAVIFIPTYYFVTKWYIKNLYGNYVNELKEELKELEGLEE